MLKRQILKGVSWLFAGRLVSNALGLLSTLVAARLLVPDDFGLMAIAMSVFGIASAVVDLPVGAALVQMKVATQRDFDTAWTINFLRGLVVAGLMLAMAWPAALIAGDPRLVGLVAALAAYPLLSGLRNSWFEQYIRDMDFRREALLDVITKIVSLSVTVWVGLATGSYWALPLGLIAAALAGTAGSYLLRWQFPAFSLYSFRKFFGFSLWVGLGNVADSVRDAATTFFMGRMLGTAKLGVFAVGSQFGERLELVLYAPMERTLFAAFSSIQDDMVRLRAAYLRSIHMSFAVILPVCAGMALLAPEIIGIALGPGWEVAALVLAFVAPITAIYLIAGLSNSLANALGHPKELFRWKAVSAAIHVPVIGIGLAAFGLVGGLWACAFTAALWYVFSLRVVSKITGLTIWSQLSVIGRTAGSALVMCVAVAALRAAVFSEPETSLTGMLAVAGCLSVFGAIVHVSCHAMLWQLGGRPEGIERDALALLTRRSASPAAA